MTRAESAVRAIKEQREQGVKGYDLRCDELRAIYSMSGRDCCAFGHNMFLMGFVKGRRYEKANRKGK